MAESCANVGEDERKLSEIFDDVLERYEKITNSDESSSSSKLQTEIKNCISLLEKCTHLINAAGLFSSNETFDEIPTQNVKYLIIPALLGKLILQVQSPERLNALNVAEIYFKDFLKRIEEYEIVNCTSLNDLEETEENAQPNKLDLRQMAMERNEKIRKYKEQKEMTAELKRLKKLMITDNDDETSRNYFTTYIKSLVSIALNDLKLIKQEKPLATHFAESRTKKRTYDQKKVEEEKVHVPPLKPVIITRNQFQKKVFGAGYPSLPIYTVEEFYKQRVAEGIFPVPGSCNKKVLQELTDPEIAEKKEEEEEIEKEEQIETDDKNYLEKTRNMDEYKDSHRRGWGNRMNRS